MGLNIDGEAEIKEIEISGYKGVSYKKYDDWVIVWNNGYYVLELTGNVEYDLLITPHFQSMRGSAFRAC